MKVAFPLGLAALLLTAGIFLIPGNAADNSVTILRVKTAPLAPELPRYGLNLGGSGTWGAEQLRANVLANPGFEPIIDRAIVMIGDVGAQGFSDDTDWLVRPAGFWSGGRYDVRSGDAAGQYGGIRDSTGAPAKGAGRFTVDGSVSKMRKGDVVSVTQESDSTIAPHWWRGKGMVAASRDVPPDSGGLQSLRLIASAKQPAEILHYLDNIGDRAGKLLPVSGKWKLAFWARQAGANASLQFRFERERSPAFLDRRVIPGRVWTHYEFEFNATDEGPAGVLTLGITARDGEILIDEIYLGEAAPGAGGFRQVVVDTLNSLHPGYLRDWQGQLGDTFENRLNGEFPHRPARYRPGNDESQFHYSLPDFLALCASVKAQPWVIAPTTLSDEEWRRFGAYLHAAFKEFGFKEIFVEFGNENWNSIFRPAGIPDAMALGTVADRGFRLLREAAGNDARLRSVINAQFVNSDGPARLAKLSTQADRIGVAPYFMYQLDAGASPGQALKLAFDDDEALLSKEVAETGKQGKRLSVYEVNFHTTLGTAGSAQRNQITTGAASGTALGRRLLQASLAGVREQAVYSFAGFDSYVNGSKELVRLWGITRDLSVAGRLRPTGLALAMLNRVSGGSPHAIDCSGKSCGALTRLAFAGGRKMAIASASDSPQTLSVKLDCRQAGRYRVNILDGSDSLRNNETRTEVVVAEQTVTCLDNELRFTLPPFSLATLEPV